MLIKFTDCRLAINGKLIDQDLWIDSKNGIIVDPQTVPYDTPVSVQRTISLNGKIIAPGYIDIQINGAVGIDFSVFTSDDEYSKGISLVNKALVKFGVTSYCPTLTSHHTNIHKQVCPLRALLIETLPHLHPSSSRHADTGAEILGVHVEGPFLNPGKRGIHSPSVFRTVSEGGFYDLETCYGVDALKSSNDHAPLIRIITGAPELNGMMKVIKECSDRGIVFSIGHSTASIETAENAVKSGAKLITHLFNAMEQLPQRDPGVIGLLGADDDLPRPYYGIICDGIHIHKTCVKLAYRSHPTGAILVTDGMAQLGSPNGTYDWTNGKRVTKEGMRLTLENEETIAGR